MFKNKYFYNARLLPAVITSIPMLIFCNKIFAVQYNEALKNVFDILPTIAHLGLSAAVITICIQLNRFVSKEIFQRLYFREELKMPTTNYLMINSPEYPDAIKNKIRAKIKDNFTISLLDESEERQNEINARKSIATAVSQIRIALKGNAMLLQHNIEYGFWRNLIGGAFWASILSIVIIIYGHSEHQYELRTVGIICLSVYLIPIVLSKLIITKYGKYYAKILFEQFLSLP